MGDKLKFWLICSPLLILPIVIGFCFWDDINVKLDKKMTCTIETTGALISGGISTVSHKVTKGSVDSRKVGRQGLFAATTGAVGGARLVAGKVAAATATNAGRMGRAVAMKISVNGFAGGTGGADSYMATTPPNKWTLGGLAGSVTGGTLAGSVGGLARPLGDTISKEALRASAQGNLARSISYVTEMSGEIIGGTAGGVVSGDHTTLKQAAWTVDYTSVTRKMSVAEASKGQASLNQLSYCNPTSALRVPITINGRRLVSHAGTGALIGVGAAYATNDIKNYIVK